MFNSAHAGCMNDRGVDYRDGAIYTDSGHLCMNWIDVYDQPVNPIMYPDSGWCRLLHIH